MFTGIVQGLCPIVHLDDAPSMRRLTVDAGNLVDGVQLGASIAINGVCLTVTGVDQGLVRFDVIRETLSLTNLGTLGVGDLVNAERSFRVGDEVGGHMVSGHVSGMVELVGLEETTNERNLRFSAPPDLMKYLLHKGYVSLDGASLTLAFVDNRLSQIGVCLIPETIARTTLGRVKPGDRINLEVDSQTQAIVDTVERVLAQPVWRDRLGGAD